MNNRITDIVAGVEKLTGDYGIIFADLNGLKLVNDRDGHLAGDILLKSAAAVLKATFEDEDIFRVGGDEFLILVTGKDKSEFEKLVQKLRDNVAASKTVSLALGTFFGDASMDIRNAMHLADERMYEDKEEYYRQHPDLHKRSS
jgi:diguanylate cyclase (GGDEF)-like protein